MSDDEKAMYLSLAMGAIEIVMSEEKGIKIKGSRVSVLTNLYENAGRTIDLYRLVSWPLDKQLLAGKVLDRIQAIITQSFKPKLVARDARGRFKKLS